MGQLHNAFQVAGGDDGARRIRRRIQNDDLGSRGNRSFNGIRRNAKILRFFGGQIDDLTPGILNDVLEGDPVGDRQNDLIAVVHQHLDGVEQRQLPARGEDRLIRRCNRTRSRTRAVARSPSAVPECRRPPYIG